MATPNPSWLRLLPFETRHKIDMLAIAHELYPDELLIALLDDALSDLRYTASNCSHRFHRHANPTAEGDTP